MGGIFRSYDIRGVYGKDLDERIARAIGKAFAVYTNSPEVYVGGDMRISTPSLKKAVMEGLVECGVQVFDVGIVPTPAMSRLSYTQKKPTIMVTASHNPPEWNGFKLRNSDGLPLREGKGLDKLERLVNKGINCQTEKKGSTTKVDFLEDYVEQLETNFHKMDVKAIVDVGNGMGGVAKKVYEKLVSKVNFMYEEPDGRFPNHIPDPFKEENLQDLVKAVKSSKADVGIAFDGDCDRVGVVSSNGKILTLESLAIAFAKSHSLRSIVVDVRFPVYAIRFLEDVGVKVFVTRVGNPFIMEKFIERNASLAVEMSGHVWFNEWKVDDGIFAGLKILELFSQHDVSSLLSDVEKWELVPDYRIYCPDEIKQDVVERLAEILSKEHEVVRIDGVKVVEDDFAFLIRKSNTQPAITISVEAKENVAKRLDEVKRLVKEVIDSFQSS